VPERGQPAGSLFQAEAGAGRHVHPRDRVACSRPTEAAARDRQCGLPDAPRQGGALLPSSHTQSRHRAENVKQSLVSFLLPIMRMPAMEADDFRPDSCSTRMLIAGQQTPWKQPSDQDTFR